VKEAMPKEQVKIFYFLLLTYFLICGKEREVKEVIDLIRSLPLVSDHFPRGRKLATL
jgi:hypothetical protein